MPQDAAVLAQPDAGPQPQNFIFLCELSEVYLLLDHLSGFAGKSLPSESEDPIREVCLIGWPPTTSACQRAEQATTLLHAKDLLNRAAQPATGATIAFTLLVAGGSDVGAPPVYDETGWRKPPSRGSLAALAYPGLVATANTFRRWMRLLIAGLALWLVATCGMSWNVAAGHAILTRIDALDHAEADFRAKIAAADLDDARGEQGTQTDGPIRPYCERHRATGPTGEALRGERFKTIAALQVCEPLERNTVLHRIAFANLSDWLLPWEWLRYVQHRYCGGSCLATDSDRGETALGRNATDAQWASILNEVLASAVLPVFYGILGASAAIVRDLGRKMRDSLLSPRDLTLSLAQLALGAVIGACIGLFVTPSGSPAADAPTLTGAVSLSASALSFIAGFGVEGVFVALEAFMGRIFGGK